jgi:hypothetical protein
LGVVEPFTRRNGLKEKAMPEDWLRTDEKENAVDSLEMTAELLRRMKDTNTKSLWKWISISLFNALYGFCICAIQGTNPDRVREIDKRTGQFKDKLISFPEALKRTQEHGWMHQFTQSQTLTLTTDQKQNIEKLRKDIRNNFEHFTPKGWSIEISGMPEIVSDAIDVIEFLTLSSGNPLWDIDSKQEQRIRDAIGKIRSSI